MAVYVSGSAVTSSPTRSRGGRQSYRRGLSKAANAEEVTPIRHRTAPQLCARAYYKALSTRRSISARAFAEQPWGRRQRAAQPRRLP